MGLPPGTQIEFSKKRIQIHVSEYVSRLLKRVNDGPRERLAALGLGVEDCVRLLWGTVALSVLFCSRV